MTKTNQLSIARQLLADAIAKSERRTPGPLNVSPWIAMSLLQKAIRRGHEDLALHAAATLLENSPERLWRRCGGIAFEDIGLADLETLSLVTAALTGKRFRAKLGGEWPVTSCIVSKMAQATKCRAADDLLMSAELHPAYQRTRDQLASARTQELLDIVIGAGDLAERAIALWYAIGTDRRPTDHLKSRRGDPRGVFDLLRQSGYPPMLVEIAWEGFRKTGEVLAPFVVFLSDQGLTGDTKVSDDPFPPETMIGDVPSWSYDIYSREGCSALGAFIARPSETARWVRSHIPPSKQVNFLGGIVFREEGGLVRRRLRWSTADDRRQVCRSRGHAQGNREICRLRSQVVLPCGPLQEGAPGIGDGGENCPGRPATEATAGNVR